MEEERGFYRLNLDANQLEGPFRELWVPFNGQPYKLDESKASETQQGWRWFETQKQAMDNLTGEFTGLTPGEIQAIITLRDLVPQRRNIIDVLKGRVGYALTVHYMLQGNSQEEAFQKAMDVGKDFFRQYQVQVNQFIDSGSSDLKDRVRINVTDLWLNYKQPLDSKKTMRDFFLEGL